MKNSSFPVPIVTPSTKAPKGGRDVSISAAEVLGRSLVDDETFEKMAAISLALFERGTELAAQKGIILVDTKYEFGIDAQGALLLVDEIHTPDSSRFWYTDSYNRLYGEGREQQEYDKEFIRLCLAAQGFDGSGPLPAIPASVFVEASLRYMKVCEDITGRQLDPEVGYPAPRILSNLQRFLASG